MEIRGWQILRCPWIRISDHPSIVQDRDSKETQLYKPIVYVVTLFDQMGCNPLKVCSRCRDNHFKTNFILVWRIPVPYCELLMGLRDC